MCGILVLTVSVNDGEVLEVTPNCDVGTFSYYNNSQSLSALQLFKYVQLIPRTHEFQIFSSTYFLASSSNGHFSTMYSSIIVTLA